MGSNVVNTSFKSNINMFKSEKFIEKYKKILVSGATFYNPDTSMLPVEKFKDSKLKFLLIFPTPASVKTVSSTAAAINSFVVERCPDVFIDFAYMPEGEDIKHYDSNNMPYAIGNITHLDASHFDIIGFSISVLNEIVTAPVMLKSFERCDTPIDLFWSDRKDKDISTTPIIYAGGITASCGDVMFGKVGDKQAFIDFLYLGEVDKTDVIFNRLICAKANHKVIRNWHDNDKPGYDYGEQPSDFQTEIEVNTVQEFVDSLNDMNMIYQPQSYDVEYNKYGRIVKNIKINPKARDFVEPYYPHKMEDFLGVGRQIIPANGDNTGTTQTQVSNGCSASGQCSFAVVGSTKLYTDLGVISIEEAFKLQPKQVYALNKMESIVKINKLEGLHRVWRVTTKLGQVLECDENHKFVSQASSEVKYIKTRDLLVGTVIPTVIKEGDILKPVFDEIMSVEPTDVFDYMYDVVDSESHLCCYNGIVTHQCFAEGTLVTTDKGLVRIENIKPGCKVYNGNSYETVTKVYDNGIQDCLRFSMTNGNQLTVTPSHDLLDKDGNIKFACDFKVGDGLCSVNNESMSLDKTSFDAKMLYLAGYFLGDGSYTKDHNFNKIAVRFYFSRTEQGISNMQLVESWLADLGYEYIKEDNIKNTTVRFHVKNPDFVKTITDLVGDKEKLTDSVLSLSKTDFLWFLSGLIASDGTVSNGDIQIGMVNHKLVLDIYHKCQSFGLSTGIDTTVYKQAISDHPRFKDYVGREITKYRVRFSLQDNLSFTTEQIKSFGLNKTEKIKYPTIKRQLSNKNIVSEIEEVKGIHVYNLTVEPSHKLVVNGNIITSQCHEGAYTGGWVEKDKSTILHEIMEAKKYSAGYKYKPFSFNAIVEGTLIPTVSGVKPIEQFSDKDIVRSFNQWSYFKARLCDTHESYLRFKFNYGIPINLTQHHRQLVLTSNGLDVKYANQLKIGDWIPTSNINITGISQLDVIDEYYVLGLWYGDGVRAGKSCRILFNPSESELYNLLLDYGYLKSKGSLNKGSLVFSLSKDITSLIKKVFPDTSYKEDISGLYNLDYYPALQFIRGLFDADGYSGKTNMRFVQKSSRVKLLEWVSVVLSSAGITTKLSDSIEVDYNKTSNKRFSYNYLDVIGSSKSKFIELINPVLSKRLYNLSNTNNGETIPSVVGLYLSKLGVKPTRETSKFIRGIENVSRTFFLNHFSDIDDDLINHIKDGMSFVKINGIQLVEEPCIGYDLLETKDHVFKAGTIITHNCNYLTDYKGMLGEFIQRYPKVTFINMRMEELGRDPDALTMMKMIGSNRLSCLDKDTLVTTDKGLVPIKDLKEGDTVLSVKFNYDDKNNRLSHQEAWSTVKAVKNQGIKSLYTITTNQGRTIVATDDHLFLTYNTQGGVDSNTWVVSSEGPIKIDSVNNQALYSDDNLTTVNVGSTKEQSLIELGLDVGNSQLLSPNCQLQTISEKGLQIRSVNDLTTGDVVLSRNGMVQPVKADRTSKAYFLGLWYGDGSRSGDKSNLWLRTRQFVGEHEYELIEHCNNSEFFKYKNCEIRQDHVIVYQHTKEFTNYIKSIFPSYKQDVSGLSQLSWQEAVDFIAGLFDADGSCSDNTIDFTQSIKHLDVLNFVITVLNAMGIRMSRRVNRWSYGDGNKSGISLRVVGEYSTKLFADIIGFIDSSKQSKIKSEFLLSKCIDRAIPAIVGPLLERQIKDKYPEFIRTSKMSHFLMGKQGMLLNRFIELFGDYDTDIVNLVKRGITFQTIKSKSVIEGPLSVSQIISNNLTVVGSFITSTDPNRYSDVKVADLLGKQIIISSNGESHLETVESIDFLKEDECWDIQVEGEPYFFANNMLVHNCPLEGMSPRIMNNLLNKCLSEEAIQNVMEYAVHGKMTDLKIGMIFTSYEQDQDFQWIVDFFDKYNNKAKTEGGNFTARLKATPLVAYSNTTIEYLERKSAFNSFKGKRWLTDEWYEKFKEHNVSFKVNGFRYSTFLEQSFVDQGRRLTSMIYKHFIKPLAPIYSLRSIATDEFVHDLSLLADPYHYTTDLTPEQQEDQKKYLDGYFGDRDPNHYISPVHRIHIELLGSYISRARRLLKAKQSGDIFTMEPDIRCLKTYENAPVKCLKNCMKSEPFRAYNDVELIDNELKGSYREVLGCERCQTVEQQKARLVRPILHSIDSKQLAAIPRMAQVQKLRFVIKRDPQFSVLNPNNTAHTFVTKFLQLSDNLLNAYHSINVHNEFWQADPQTKYFVSGFQVVDTIWSKDVYQEIKALIPKVNEMLKSTQIISVTEELLDEKIRVDDINIFSFVSSLPLALFDSAQHLYKGEIRIYGGMGTTEIIKDPKLSSPIFASKGKVYGAFALTTKYNPVEYLSSFLSVSKKTSIDKIVESTDISCNLLVRETKAVCSKCGKEHALISLITGKPLQFGKECLTKALASQWIKR